MKDPLLSAAPKSGMGLALSVLVGALGLTVVAASLTAIFFQRLPSSQQATIHRSDFNQRFGAVLRSAGPEAREARVFWELGSSISSAVSPLSKSVKIPNNLTQAAMSATTSQLGRVLAAGTLLARADTEGRPIAQQWPLVKPYLEGLGDAKFVRNEGRHETLLAAAFQADAVRPGTARQLAANLPEAYTPFLQFFVDRLRALGAERRAAGDVAAADLCRRIALRLLREWTLETGPAGTRLVAADLLARELSPEPAAKPVADALTNWRKAFHQAAAARPAGMLSLGSDPDLSGGIERSVIGLLYGAIGFAFVTPLVAVVALALAWPLLRSSEAIRTRSSWVFGALAVGVIVVAGVFTMSNGRQAISDDMRGMMLRMASDATPAHRSQTWMPIYWARLPWNAAAAAAVAIAAATACTIVSSKSGRRPGAIGASLAITWLFFAAVWLLVAGLGIVRLGAYEAAVAAGYQRGVIATVVGEQSEAMLAPVRAWNP